MWWPEQEWADKCDRLDTDFDAISVGNILGFFFVILFGLVCALLTLVLKYIQQKRKFTRIGNISNNDLHYKRKSFDDNISIRSENGPSIESSHHLRFRRRCVSLSS